MRNKIMDEIRETISPEMKKQMELSVGIANRIYDLLEEKGLSQKEFAHMMGKTETEVSRWLSGTHNLTMSTIAKISLALGKDIIQPIQKPRRTHTLPLLALLTLLTLAPLTTTAQTPAQSDRNFTVVKNLDIFNSIYRKLEQYYVDTLDAQQLIRTAIDAMLERLDPYTEYYAAEEMGDLKMMTTGKYGGIGSIIRMRKDSTVIIYEPYADMPAAQVGLQVGDILRKIDGKDLTGKSTSEVSEMLRGEPGTTFLLTISRPGETKTRDFKITRQVIKVPPITYQCILDGDCGYIDLEQFTEDCYVDVSKAITSLKQQGAKRLILDLRSNGGGLLSEAVNLANLFLPQGVTIVETKGKRPEVESTYKTQHRPLDLDIPLAILVGNNTASSAEIVSGALQDLHRATLVGQQTYGKGLVQAPQELPYGGSLKLTTSKYYLPSGRCIQKIDYKARREGVQEDNPSAGSETESQETTQNPQNSQNPQNQSKLQGGITPDYEVHHDTIQNIVYYLSNDDILTDFGTHYCQTHTKPASVTDISITDTDLDHFLTMLQESQFSYDPLSEKLVAELKKMTQFEGYYEGAKDEFAALEKKLTHDLQTDFHRHRKDIQHLLIHEIAKRWFYQAGTVQQSLTDDPDLTKALEILQSM